MKSIRAYLHRNHRRLALLALLLAVLGLVDIIKLVYSPGLPSAANALVLEYTSGEVDVATSFLSTPESVPFRLYGDGLLICGPGKATPYTATRLSRQQITGLVDQVVDTGFTKLNHTYSADQYRIAEFANTITLNRHNTSTQVTYYSGPAVQAFDRTAQLLDQTCTTVTERYIPNELKVLARRVPSHMHSLTDLGAWDQSLAFPDGNAEINGHTYQGGAVRQVIDRFGNHNHGYFTYQGAMYEMAYYVTLPEYIPASNALASRNQAVAAGSYEVRYYWWVARGDAVAPQADQRGSIATSIRDWYTARVGKSYNLTAVDIIQGNKTAAEYRTCTKSGGCKSLIEAVYDNLYKEYTARFGVTPYSSNMSINILAQFDDGQPGCTGLGGSNAVGVPNPQNPTEADYIKYNTGGFGITLNIHSTNRQPGQPVGCQDSERQYEFPAHEGGHTFGLAHRFSSQTIMDYYNCVWPSGCTLDGWQGASLRDTSPFFQGGGGSSTPLPPPPPPPPSPPASTGPVGCNCVNNAVGIVATPSGNGYWLVTSNGKVFNYGDAPHKGDAASIPLAKPVVGMSSSPSGQGYWLVASDGGIFAFGDAPFKGSTGAMVLNKPIVGIDTTASGQGYWLVASDGGIFSFGDATFKGSTGAMALNKPVVGMSGRAGLGTPRQGYWLVASDGGIFSFGTAPFLGSTGALTLKKPIVGMTSTTTGKGYWFVAADGGVFAFGDAPFLGSLGNLTLVQPIVGMAARPANDGYWLVAADGGVFGFGNAKFLGRP